MPKRLSKRTINAILFLLIALVVSYFSKDGTNFLQDPATLGDKISKAPSPAVTISIDPKAVIKPAVEKVEATIVRVVDGDTVRVSIAGKEVTLRLIGINTPETVDPRKEVECFGKEASNRAKEVLTKDTTVLLESDPSQDDIDKYGRPLRYVFLSDGTNFNKQMIAEGYAYEYTYDLPYKYQSEFKQAQEEAQNGKKGLWSDATCKGNK